MAKYKVGDYITFVNDWGEVQYIQIVAIERDKYFGEYNYVDHTGETWFPPGVDKQARKLTKAEIILYFKE